LLGSATLGAQGREGQKKMIIRAIHSKEWGEQVKEVRKHQKHAVGLNAIENGRW